MNLKAMDTKLAASKKLKRLEVSFKSYQSEIGPLMDQLKLCNSEAKRSAADAQPVRYGSRLNKETDASDGN